MNRATPSKNMHVQSTFLAVLLCGVLLVLGSGCATAPPPEHLIGKTYLIERTVGGRTIPWGKLTIQKAHFSDKDVEDGDFLAQDLIASMKDFSLLIGQSKIASATPASGAVANPLYTMSISFFDDISVDGRSVLLSRILLNTVGFKGETQTTVTLVVERADGLRKFFRAESRASGKLSDAALPYLGVNPINPLRLVDILHLSTDNCCKVILGQMEQETNFFTGAP